jgi:o-succinylbenzoate synthase
MVIVSAEAFRYGLSLTAPLVIGHCELRCRDGIIIRLADEDFHYGYGEVSPLPGLHNEDLHSALMQWRDLSPELVGQGLSQSLRALDNGFECRWGNRQLLPSLRYGLEMAVLNLLACQQSISLAGLLAPSYPQSLAISGLVMDNKDVESQLLEMRSRDFATVKLKVGRRSLRDDITIVRTARRLLGEEVTLRLDGNRRWDFETAVRFARAVTDCTIEYIEEPLSNPIRLAEFCAFTGMAAALDESLVGQDPEQMVLPQGVESLILKPAILGGLERTKGWISRTRDLKIKPIISSTFESGVGLATLVQVAAALTGGEYAAGLDTYRWLGDDLLEERFEIGAVIDVNRADGQARQLRKELLTALV